MRPDELERRLRERLDALGPAPRAELLHVLTLPDFERADRIGEFWGNPNTRTYRVSAMMITQMVATTPKINASTTRALSPRPYGSPPYRLFRKEAYPATAVSAAM
jgi:hypothetical protein